MTFPIRTILAPANAPITLSELFLSPSIPDPGTRSATPRDAAPTFFTPTTNKRKMIEIVQEADCEVLAEMTI